MALNVQKTVISTTYGPFSCFQNCLFKISTGKNPVSPDILGVTAKAGGITAMANIVLRRKSGIKRKKIKIGFSKNLTCILKKESITFLNLLTSRCIT